MGGTIGRLAAELAESAEASPNLATLRRRVLVRIQRLIGCETAYWGEAPMAAADANSIVISGQRDAQEALARFARRRQRYDVPRAIQAARSAGGVVIGEEIISRSQSDRLPVYVEIVRPAGIRSFVWCEITFRNRGLSVLTLSRHAGERRFAAKDRERLRSIKGAIGLVEAAFRVSACMPMLDVVDRLPAKRGLSPRESQVATMIARGLQNKEIAELLGTSCDTVRKQTIRIYEKTGVSGRVQLVAQFADALGRDGAIRIQP